MEEIPTRSQRWRENLKFFFIAGGGLFGDGYLNNTIGLVVPMIGYIYFKDHKGAVPAFQGDQIKGSLSVGMIVGQLVFGVFGDVLGRQRVYGKECLFTILGTLMVVLLPWKGLSEANVVSWFFAFRVMTGMGTGGDYPMTSTLSAEHRIVGTRARLIMLVFSFIGLGSLVAGIVFLVLLTAFKSAIESDINRLEWVWRLLLGLGIIPAAFTLYFRLKMKETKPYETWVATETSLTDRSKRNFGTQMREFRQYFSEWKHAKVLFAAAASWFLYDIAFYGISLNQSVILAEIGFAGGKTQYESLYNIAVGNIIVSMAGSLPGVYIGVFLPDLIGRRNQQFYSCLMATALYAIWAGVSNVASSAGLITLFTLTQLVLNGGPNITTFLNPVELFPTRVRGTAHGICAAAGKCGAVLTAFAFGSLNNSIGLRGALGLFSGIMFLVALLTLMIPEVKGMTLEEIENGALYGEERQASVSEPSVTSSIAEAKGIEAHVTTQAV